MYNTTNKLMSQTTSLSSSLYDSKRRSIDENSHRASTNAGTQMLLQRPVSPAMGRTTDLRKTAYKTRPASRMVSELTNAKIDSKLRSKIIHQVARRQYDQNTTSEEQLRSFKIINQLQKQQTGSISPQQKQRYGTLIKAAVPTASIDEASIGLDSIPSISIKDKFAKTGFATTTQPARAST